MDTQYPEALEKLISHMKLLPGVGRRSAERMALAMLKFPDGKLESFGDLILHLRERVFFCPVCGNLSRLEATPCDICRSGARDGGTICVVEDFTRIAGIEKAGNYRGVYHVLGGRLAPLDDETESDLRIAELDARIAAGQTQDEGTPISELILALGGDVEGRATAIFLKRRYENQIPVITQLAQGLPAGADLAYADSATIAAALSGRRNL